MHIVPYMLLELFDWILLNFSFPLSVSMLHINAVHDQIQKKLMFDLIHHNYQMRE